jgi:hypothetical protein
LAASHWFRSRGRAFYWRRFTDVVPMDAKTEGEGWHRLSHYIVWGTLSLLVFLGAPETVRWLHGGAFAQTVAPPPPNGSCNNYGPNGTITGSCNTTINPIVHDPNGLYQSDERVGKIQNPSINEAQGIANFAAANFTEYPNPNKPLEYGNLLLSCDNVPVQPPNTYVGTLSASIVGFQCRIVGKK